MSQPAPDVEPEPAGDLRLVLCTVPEAEAGARLGRELVGARLAACVNLVPGLRSIYRWQDQICDESEVLLIIKTTANRLPGLMTHLKALHPYEVPEMLSFLPDAGWPAYVQWVRDNSRAATVPPGSA